MEILIAEFLKERIGGLIIANLAEILTAQRNLRH